MWLIYSTELLRSNLVCLAHPVQVTGNRKDTSLLQNMSIFCTL
jgi:hypothetical protein